MRQSKTRLPRPQPVRWNMPGILLFASIMGLLSVVETFGLLLIGLRWVADPQLQEMIKLDHAQLQTVMFLQLAVGGHLLLFVVRTKRSLFEPPYPSARLSRRRSSPWRSACWASVCERFRHRRSSQSGSTA